MAKKKNKKNYEDKTPASVGFVRQIVDEAVDSILTGMQKMHDEDKKRFEKLEIGQNENTSSIAELKKGQNKLIKDQKKNTESIKQLQEGQEEIKVTLNDMALKHPSSEEFNALKKKVFRHHPSN